MPKILFYIQKQYHKLMKPKLFSQFINSLSATFVPLLSRYPKKESYGPLDLSVSNKDLYKIDVSNSRELGSYIENQMALSNVDVAFGGYDEVRGIYKRSEHFETSDDARNIHLGLDLWSNAEESIIAPLSGIVYSLKNNTNYGDYGPTVILKHEIEEFVFYTLYGHLSIETLDNLEIGQHIEKGQVFSQLGDYEVNGDYKPHLHFQIIHDMQGAVGDYPGVCNQQNRKFYMQNCPDPDLLLNLK